MYLMSLCTAMLLYNYYYYYYYTAKAELRRQGMAATVTRKLIFSNMID